MSVIPEREFVVVGRSPADSDVVSIVALIDRQATTWNNQQPMREADFAPESDYVTFDGTELHGFEENAKLHKDLGRGILRGSHLTCHVHRVRFLTNDVAVAHSTGNLQLRFHPRPKPSRNSIQTTIVRRTPQGWQIEAFHNTRIRKPGPTSRLFVRLLNKL